MVLRAQGMTAAGERGGLTSQTARPTWTQKAIVHQDLDKHAADQKLLEKNMRDTLRVSQKYLDVCCAPVRPEGLGRFVSQHGGAGRRSKLEGVSNKHPSSTPRRRGTRLAEARQRCR